jgi:hypothetical protein
VADGHPRFFFFAVPHSIEELMNRLVRHAGALALIMVASSGCYSYVEVPVDAVRPGQAVRITLDRAEALRRADERDEFQQRVTGTVTEQTTDEAVGLSYIGTRGSDFRDFMLVNWESVELVEGREVSWLRTGGVAALGALAAVAILEIADNSSGGNNEGGINESMWTRIPLLRIVR